MSRTTMPPPAADPWADVSAARLPADRLAALAAVRDRPEVRVTLTDGFAWVSWPAGAADVVRCVRAVPGAVLFARREFGWVRLGAKVPTADGPPDDPGRPLDAVVVPAKFEPVPPPTTAPTRVTIRLVRGGVPAPATALRCRLADLAGWADAALTAELAAVRGAVHGGGVLLLGRSLPSLPGAVRYYGESVLAPVGFRFDPDLPAATLRDAAGVSAEELLVFDEHRVEAVPTAAFEPLTRAGVRLALDAAGTPARDGTRDN